MAKVLYIRVSTADQNEERQKQDLEGYDKVFIDKCSGATTNRPQLKAMMDYLRDGDIVEVHSFDRLARNTFDLLGMVEGFEKDGITLISKKESLDTRTPSGKMMLTMLGAVAEFERSMIKERQREGIANMKVNKDGKKIGKTGIATGRPKANYDTTQAEIFKQLTNKEIKSSKAMELTGLKKTTFYKLLKEWKSYNN